MFTSLAHGAVIARTTGANGPVLGPEEEKEKSRVMRQAICDELVWRRSDIEPFLEVPFEDYIREMRREGVWGGEIELSVAPHVVSAPVQVFQVHNGALMMIGEYKAPADAASGARPVTLFFHRLGHYDVLIQGGESEDACASCANVEGGSSSGAESSSIRRPRTFKL